MNTTQNFLPIKDIRSDLVILKDGSVSCVIKTSAVNFGLLSENEQLAIISSFAGLLNSLSFPIQIMIRSKRLDISSYLEKLIAAQNAQTNPLLREIITRYRFFIESVIRENEVLDKQFYITLSVSYLELGVINDIEKHFTKAMTILNPRRDHVIRQLERIGLRATQLNSEGLTRLFYDLLNEVKQEETQLPVVLPKTEQQAPNPALPTPVLVQPERKNPPPQPQQSVPLQKPAVINPSPQQVANPISPQARGNTVNSGSRLVPFIVEELPDEYSAI